MIRKQAYKAITSNAPIPIMLVDDHALVRGALKHILENQSDIQIIAEASTGEKAIQLAKDLKPTIVLMDFDMPDMSGLEVTERLKRILPEVKIIIVSAFTHEVIASRLLAEGAAGFVAKGAAAEEIIEAIKTVNNGKKFISTNLATQLAEATFAKNQSLLLNQLSNKELLMVLMITQGYRNPKIAEKLHLSVKTVSAYRSSLFRKLGVENDVALSLFAIEHRLIEVEQI